MSDAFPAVTAAARRLWLEDWPDGWYASTQLAWRVLEDATPHLRVEFLSDLADELAEVNPTLAQALDELAAAYREELVRRAE